MSGFCAHCIDATTGLVRTPWKGKMVLLCWECRKGGIVRSALRTMEQAAMDSMVGREIQTPPALREPEPGIKYIDLGPAPRSKEDSRRAFNPGPKGERFLRQEKRKRRPQA